MRANHPGEILKNSGCPIPLCVFCSCFAEGSHVLHMHACDHCWFFLCFTCHHVDDDAEICSSTGSSTPFAPQTSSLICHILSQITATRTVGLITQQSVSCFVLWFFCKTKVVFVCNQFVQEVTYADYEDRVQLPGPSKFPLLPPVGLEAVFCFSAFVSNT